MRKCGLFTAFVVGCVICAIGACVINAAINTVDKINIIQNEKYEIMLEIFE